MTCPINISINIREALINMIRSDYFKEAVNSKWKYGAFPLDPKKLSCYAMASPFMDDSFIKSNNGKHGKIIFNTIQILSYALKYEKNYESRYEAILAALDYHLYHETQHSYQLDHLIYDLKLKEQLPNLLDIKKFYNLLESQAIQASRYAKINYDFTSIDYFLRKEKYIK